MIWRLIPILFLSAVIGCGRTTTPQTPLAPVTEVTWAVVFLNGAKVGYAKTTRQESMTDREPVVHYEQTTCLRLKRFGETVENSVNLSSEETASGELRRCEWSLSNGLSSVATVNRDQLILRSTVNRETVDSALPLPPRMGGYFCLEQSLRNRPMSVGEERELVHLAPVVNQIVTVRLSAAELESTDILGTARQLLRIDAQTMIGDSPLEMVLWADSSGAIVKSLTPGIDEMIVRSDESTALSDFVDATDIGHFTAVKVTGLSVQPHRMQQATYRLTWTGTSGPFAVMEGRTQRVTSISPTHCEIVVRAIQPDSTTVPGMQAGSPTAAHLAASHLIQTEDPAVRRMAHQVTEASDPWEVAVALESLVHASIERKNFSRVFDSAAEVARSKQGDCTEHAMLLAGVCRIRGIPARAVLGLVHTPAQNCFGFHMWNEVWIRDRWIPLDATLALGGIGAGHIKLAEFNEDRNDSLGMSGLLPVMNFIGKLNIEVIAAE